MFPTRHPSSFNGSTKHYILDRLHRNLPPSSFHLSGYLQFSVAYVKINISMQCWGACCYQQEQERVQLKSPWKLWTHWILLMSYPNTALQIWLSTTHFRFPNTSLAQTRGTQEMFLRRHKHLQEEIHQFIIIVHVRVIYVKLSIHC